MIIQKELNNWYHLAQRLENNQIEEWMRKELLRLNHLVMEEANKIHNDNMLSK